MPAVLPFLLLIVVWLLFASLFPKWGLRRAFLRALVAWGAWAYLSIEILSPFHAITFAGIVLVWLMPLVACSLWLVRRWRSGQVVRVDFSWLAGWEMKLLLAVLLVILVVTGLVAWLAPPNTFDSLRYHMPRVAEWAQNHTVAHFPTDIEIQNSYPPGAEFGILHLYVLGRGDSLANFIEWLAMLGSLVGVTLLAGLLGAGRIGQMLAAVFAATLPMGIIQASSTMNDYVVALWMVVVAAEFLTLWAQQDAPAPVILFLGLGAALATVTKPTAFPYLLPFAIATPILLWRQTKLTTFGGLVALVLATVIIFNLGYLTRNLHTYGSIVDIREAQLQRNELMTWRGVASNLMRNLGIHLGTPWDGVNDQLTRLIRGIHFKMGLDLNDPRTTTHGEFRVLPWTASENIAPNPLHFYLILLSILVSAFAFRRVGRRIIVYELLILSSMLVFSIVFKWQIFSSRYHLPFFILLAPVVGAVLDTFLPRWISALLGLGLAAAVWYALFTMPARPLFSLSGSQTLLNSPRDSFYATAGEGTYRGFLEASSQIKASGCQQVGLVLSGASFEYPIWPLLGAPRSKVHIGWISPNSPSGRLADPSFSPCAVVCQNCGDSISFQGLPLVYSRSNLALYLRASP